MSAVGGIHAKAPQICYKKSWLSYFLLTYKGHLLILLLPSCYIVINGTLDHLVFEMFVFFIVYKHEIWFIMRKQNSK